MNINKFTQSSMAAVQNLEKIAADYGNQEIEQEHLLYSLLTIDDSLILKLIEKMGITKETMMNRVEELLRKRPKVQMLNRYIFITHLLCLILAMDQHISDRNF